MKQLLFLLLFPCLCVAQYTGNAGQKITLGEQTSADGLVYRGVANDTNVITPFSDTSAYIILDTVNSKFYHYNRTTTYWALAGGGVSVSSFSAGTTGLTPSTATTGAVTLGGTLSVANGGTGLTTFTAANRIPYSTSATNLTTSPNFNFIPGTSPNLSITASTTAGVPYFSSTNSRGFFIQFGIWSSSTGFGVIDTSEAFTYGSTNFSTTVQNQTGKVKWGIGNPTIVEVMTLSLNGLGLRQSNPTARLHLPAGTATASTAPLKFTSGTNLTTAEAGAMEFNGTNLFFSPSTTRHTVNHGLTGSNTLDFLSTNAQSSRDMTIAVTGAADGDVVSLGVPNAAVNANTSYSAWVSAANTVTVRFNNYSSGTVDPASALFKVFVTK